MTRVYCFALLFFLQVSAVKGWCVKKALFPCYSSVGPANVAAAVFFAFRRDGNRTSSFQRRITSKVCKNKSIFFTVSTGKVMIISIGEIVYAAILSTKLATTGRSKRVSCQLKINSTLSREWVQTNFYNIPMSSKAAEIRWESLLMLYRWKYLYFSEWQGRVFWHWICF